MIVTWPIYAQVVLSCFCHLGHGCVETGARPMPAGYKVMLLSDVRKNFKPNTFVLMTYSDALSQGKLQGADNGNKAATSRIKSRALRAKVVARALPAQTDRGEWTDVDVPPRDASEEDDDDRERSVRVSRDNNDIAFGGDASYAGDGGRDRLVVDGDPHDGDVWHEDVTVMAVVVDPGRRVQVFARTDDNDDGDVAAVDAYVVDLETGATDGFMTASVTDDVTTAAVMDDDMTTSVVDDVMTVATAAEDEVLAMAALYFPVVDKLAKQIVPGIRRQQVLSLALNAARATSDAVGRLAAATHRDEEPLASTHDVLRKSVNELGNYASSSIYDKCENVFPYDYQYIPSFSNSIHSNSFKQTDYEGEMYDYNNLCDNNSVSEDEYIEDVNNYEDSDYDDFDDDVDQNDDSDDDIDDDDDDDDIDSNDDISYEVVNSDHREVYVDNMSRDYGNPEVSKLDKIAQSKKISNAIRNIQLNFIKDMSGKQLVQHINGLNIKQQEPMVENQKLCINMMKFDENVSEKDIQQLITTITNASNLLIASVLEQYTAKL